MHKKKNLVTSYIAVICQYLNRCDLLNFWCVLMTVYTEIDPKILKYCVLNTESRLPGLAAL